jgi:hypothetical protein
MPARTRSRTRSLTGFSFCASQVAEGSDQLPATVGQEPSWESHITGATQAEPAEGAPDPAHDDGRSRLHRAIESLDLQEPVDPGLVASRLAQPQQNLRLHVLAVGAAKKNMMACHSLADVAAPGRRDGARGVHRALPPGGRLLR